MTMRRVYPLPRRGRVGVGASGAHLAIALCMPQAPIPAFPQRGKEKARRDEAGRTTVRRRVCSLPQQAKEPQP